MTDSINDFSLDKQQNENPSWLRSYGREFKSCCCRCSYRSHAIHFVSTAQNKTSLCIVHSAAVKWVDKDVTIKSHYMKIWEHFQKIQICQSEVIEKHLCPVRGDKSSSLSFTACTQTNTHREMFEKPRPVYELWVWNCFCIWLTQPGECRMQNKRGRTWYGSRCRM